MRTRLACGGLLWLLGSSGCSPTLDWRELRGPINGVRVSLPCRPAVMKREPRIAGRALPMAVHVCETAGTTWAVGWVHPIEGADASQVQAALLLAAASNLGMADVPRQTEWQPRSGRAQAKGLRIELQGRLPDGTPVRSLVGAIALQAGVVQLTAIGRAPDPDAVAVFFESLRLQD